MNISKCFYVLEIDYANVKTLTSTIILYFIDQNVPTAENSKNAESRKYINGQLSRRISWTRDRLLAKIRNEYTRARRFETVPNNIAILSSWIGSTRGCCVYPKSRLEKLYLSKFVFLYTKNFISFVYRIVTDSFTAIPFYILE